MNISEVIPIFVPTSIFNVTKQMGRHTTLSQLSFSRISKLLTVFIFLICSSRIYGQTHSFSGTIGKYPIYLQMTLEGSKAEGTYFYKNKLIDISLSGTYKSGVIILNASNESGGAISELESFKFKWPNKIIEGTWTQKGKSIPLKLNPLAAKETSSPKCMNAHWLKSNPVANDLTKVKIGLFRLKAVDSTKTINQIKLRYFEEVNSKITLFRIDSGLVANKQKDINSYLEYLQIEEFLESLSCASYSTYGAEYNYGISDMNLSNDLICFSVFKTYYCGGAHPNEENYGINYNLNTQKKVSSSDYLLPDKDAVFEERIYNYLAKLEPEYFNKESSIGSADVYLDCSYYQKEL